MSVLYLYNACTMSLLYLYYVCKKSLQCLYNAHDAHFIQH